jgi:hypothetical protein
VKESEWNEINGGDPAPEPELNGNEPLEFLQAVVRDPRQSIDRRMRAAGLALPYLHPKLSVAGHANLGIGLAAAIEAKWLERQERAKRRTIDVTPNKPD